MNEAADDNLEKVYIDLPNNEAAGGESLWAKPLGDDLYEIHNVPFYAYGLNYFDVVKVDSTDRTKKPVVLKVVEARGFETLRVIFEERFDRESQAGLLNELKSFKADFERASDRYVALNIEPDGDFDAVYEKLTELEEKGILEFETCEARNPEHFGGADEEE